VSEINGYEVFRVDTRLCYFALQKTAILWVFQQQLHRDLRGEWRFADRWTNVGQPWRVFVSSKEPSDWLLVAPPFEFVDFRGVIIPPIMTLAQSTRLGPYEIPAPLGAGWGRCTAREIPAWASASAQRSRRKTPSHQT